MRIFEMNTFLGGSTGRIATDIAQYAAAQGAETIIGFGAGGVPQGAEAYALRIGGPVGRKWHGALRKLLDAEGYGSLLATKRLIHFLQQYRPDVIHLHNLHGCYVNHKLLFRYLKRSGIPVVWTFHDCWALTGHCAYFDRIGCERWKTGCFTCPQKGEYPTCIGIGGSKRNYARKRNLFPSLPNLTLVTPCAWLQKITAESFLRNVPCRVIYNGVDRTRFYPVKSDLREQYDIGDRLLILAVASEWEERKGVRLLPELADKLGESCQLVVIGVTPEQRKVLPASIIGIQKTANVRELAAWYTAADCLANPTLEDNMPMVNLEAFACGTPVVAFDTGGCAEAIPDTCGAVTPKGDLVAMAVAIRQIAPQKATLTQACLSQAERFDAEASAKAYWELYQEVLR